MSSSSLAQAQSRLPAVAGRVARVGGWTIDLAKRRVHWSDEVCAIHDAPPGTTLTLEEGIAAFLPEWRPVVEAHVRACIEQGTPYDLELEKLTFTGRRIWVRTIGEAVRSDDGTITHIQGAFQDITAQREAHARQLESERRYRMLFENSLDGILHTAPDGRTLAANPAACRMLGYSEEELLSIGRDGVVDTADPRVQAIVERRRRTGQGLGEIEMRRRDGTWLPVEVATQAFRGADGELYASLFFRDISERKRAEAARAAAEAEYRHLFETAPYGIYALDVEGRFTRLNPAGERAAGRPARELIGQHFSTVIAPADLPLAQDAFDRVVSGQANDIEFDERILRPSGEERLLRVTESALRDGDRIVGTHGIARDITEEVQQQRLLRRAERLASVGTLLGGVAHELNNPLHAIRSFAELMLMEPRGADDREMLEMMQREADRAAKVVSDLRLIARNTQGEVQRTDVDVNDVLRHVVKLRGYAWATSNVELSVELAEDLPAVLANRGEIEQVVLNLVVNAEQALTDGWAGDRKLLLRTRRTSEGASIHVIDTGPGIAPRNLERIFDPFFTTKAPGEGTGLGLSLVHNIVTEHRGRIHVESEPGKGAAFRIDLPRAPARDEASPQARAGAPSSQALRILVVDDEPAIRRVMQRYLTRLEHHVDVAADGGEALRLLDRADYDVIVSDLRMPGIGGEELLRRLRDRGQGVEHRLICVTGDAASAQAVRVISEAGVPVLLKPLRLEELGRAVEHVAARVRGAKGGRSPAV